MQHMIQQLRAEKQEWQAEKQELLADNQELLSEKLELQQNLQSQERFNPNKPPRHHPEHSFSRLPLVQRLSESSSNLGEVSLNVFLHASILTIGMPTQDKAVLICLLSFELHVQASPGVAEKNAGQEQLLSQQPTQVIRFHRKSTISY